MTLRPLIHSLQQPAFLFLWFAALLAAAGCVDSPPADPAQASQRLIELLQDGDPNIRHTAALSLGKIGWAEAERPLIEALADRDVTVRSAAAWALGRLGEAASGEASSAVAAAIDDPATPVKEVAASALGQLKGTPGLVSQLIDSLHGPDPASRRAAATALGWLEAGAAIPALTGALQDEDPHVRHHALAALGETGARQSVSKILERLARDEDAGVRGEAAYRLGKLGSREVLPLLKEAAAKEPHETVRRWAQGAVRELEGVTDVRSAGSG